ncbi:hypothetical protein R3P38DRAFT_3167615 [Favolaschia claudopus]|uniref:Uncharacterized protein n=1 Tax=Favolaschia claudopus TaxID=2862362 RepID=A0AAW0E5A2_9AGAR
MPNKPSTRRDENAPPHRSKSTKTSRTSTHRLPLQDSHHHNDSGGDNAGDDDAARIRRLEDELARSQAECAQLRERQDNPPPPESAGDDSAPLVPQPQNISEVKMEDLRTELGFNKPRWNAFRSCVRHAVIAARLDWDKNWKAQDDKKKLRAFNVVRADFPEVKRFENAWAIKRVAAEYWGNRKTYGRCVDDPNTYRGRKALESRGSTSRRAPRRSAPTTHEARSSSSLLGITKSNRI